MFAFGVPFVAYGRPGSGTTKVVFCRHVSFLYTNDFWIVRCKFELTLESDGFCGWICEKAHVSFGNV